MSKYVIEFNKTGVICYTSHLDIMRMFKRTFKKTGVALAYSQGFNPHPKMSFGQPLSLGYEALEEFIEIETKMDMDPEDIKARVAAAMPEGIEIVRCVRADGLKKTLASLTEDSLYVITIPLYETMGISADEIKQQYLGQDEIVTLKKKKKSKDLVPVNIKPKIRNLDFELTDDCLKVTALLDQGSNSNLSPELVINTLLKQFDIKTDRGEISVVREKIGFTKPIDELIG